MSDPSELDLSRNKRREAIGKINAGYMEISREIDQVFGELDDLRARLAAAEQRERVLLEAIEGIFANPWGCPFCDSGVLRNPEKGHDVDCPFEIARRAILHPEAGSE